MENQPEVTVFSMPFCDKCHSLMDWMDKSDIKYTEKSLDNKEDLAYIEELAGHEIVGAPVTAVDKEVIDGFDRKAILKALGR